MFFISDTSSESSEEEVKPSKMVERRLIRQKSNIFNLSDEKFQSYFRLSKTAFNYVLETIGPKLRNGIRSTFIPKTIKLAATLRFLAQGSFQMSVGNDFNLGLSQPIVSRILSDTLEALEMTICSQWLQFEMTDDEINESKLKFLEQTGFPGVIGCVDISHIKIVAPKKEEQYLYINQKGYFSINAMIICDHKMRIRFVEAGYPGSTEDFVIWNDSDVRTRLQERYAAGERNIWLLGDSDHPLEPYLMTPYRHPTEGSAEATFNIKHAKAMDVMEKTIGLLKNRFLCLLGTRPLHYKPGKASKIVKVCAALHNICLEYGLDITYEETNTGDNYPDVVQANDEELASNSEACEIRDKIKLSFL